MGEQGTLQVAPISWDKESKYRLPVKVWKDLMDAHYPNSAWLALRRDCFERLQQFKTREGIPTWEEALERAVSGSSGSGAIMNAALVDGVVKAVLYEGYMCTPIGHPSLKNQQRFNFGVVYPCAYSEAQAGTMPGPCKRSVSCKEETKTGVHSAGPIFADGGALEGQVPQTFVDLAPRFQPEEIEQVNRVQVGDRSFQSMAGSCGGSD